MCVKIHNRLNSSRKYPYAKKAMCLFLATAFSLTYSNITFSQEVGFPDPHKLDSGVSVNHTPERYQIKHQGNAGRVFDNEWNTFNVPIAGTVDFNFSNSNQTSINRVVGNQASQILGRITESGAGGKVFLINPHGVMFGQNATVNVGSLLVSTAGLTSKDLDNMQFVFEQGQNSGSIVNEGNIKVSDTGFLTMLAPVINNKGKIEAQKGTVALISGGKYTLTMQDGNQIEVKVDDKLTSELIKDKEATVLVNNEGVINADGGEVLLSADAAEDIIASAVNHSGIIQANAIQEVNGELVLGNIELAANEKDVNVTGKINAAGEKGGEVKITGLEVEVKDNAKIDASGESGGGKVLIGGDYQGKEDVKTSDKTFIGEAVEINANATKNGDGGKVIVWSDGKTSFYGTITARGGDLLGDGGFVEVSGKKVLEFKGTVDTLAPFGFTGKLLLDPETILITNDIFDPLDTTGMVLWLDGADEGTIDLSGSNVTRWNDKSGRNNDAAQSNSSYQPVYDDVEDSVNFGDNDRLVVPNTGDINTSNYNEKTHFVVFKTPATLNHNRMIFEEGGGTNTLLFYLENNQLYIGYSNSNTAQYFGNFTVTPDTVYVGSFVLNISSQHVASLNGTTQTGTNSQTLNAHSGDISIGAAGTTNRLHDSDNIQYTRVVPSIYEVIQYGSTAISDYERQTMEAHLGDKWGVSIDNPNAGATVMTPGEIETMSLTSDVILQADKHITIADIADDVLDLTNNFTLIADADLDNDGAISMNTSDTIRTEGGTINFSAGSGITLGNLDTTGLAGNQNADITLTTTTGDIYTKDLTAGTGTVQVNAPAGNVSLNPSAGIGTSDNRIQVNAPTLDFNADGDIYLHNLYSGVTNISGNSNNDLIDVFSDNGIETEAINSSGGNVVIAAPTVDIDDTLNAGTGKVTLKPTTSKTIQVGGSTDDKDSPTEFDISRAEMLRIIADTLSIGDYNLAGDINILENIKLIGDAYDLEFNTGGDFDNSNTIILFSNSLSFDGSNDYIAISDLFYNSANSIDELTVITWMKMPDYQRCSMVDYDRSEHWSFGVNFANAGGNNGKISFDTYATSGSIKDFASDARVDDGQWHMTAGRFDSSLTNEKAIFIDGNLDSEVNQYGTGVKLGKNITRYGIIGDGSEAGSFDAGRNNTYYKGELQEVRIYEKALKNEEIADMYAQGPGAGGYTDGLLLGYDFTTGSGSTVDDFSGKGYTGYLRNNPTWLISQHDLAVNAAGNVNTGTIRGNNSNIDINAGGEIIIDNNISTTGSGLVNIVAGSDLNINTGKSITVEAPGESLVLATTGGSFINNAGATAFNQTDPTARLLVYSDNPADTTEGFTGYNKYYGISYGDDISAYDTGDYVFYYEQPTLTLTAVDKSRQYYTANPAIEYSYSGLIDGDSFNQAIDNVDPLTNNAVLESNTGVYPYILKAGVNSPLGYLFETEGGLTVNPRELTASLTGITTKVYDGNNDAELTVDNYNPLAGDIVVGDVVELVKPTSGSFDNKNTGNNKEITVNGLALTGADSGNYTLSDIIISGTIGEITAKQLTAALTGTVSKIYDGNTNATLNPENYNLTGEIINGETVDLIKPANGSYDNPDVGTNKLVSVTGVGLTGIDAGNYELAASDISGNVGEITKKPESNDNNLADNPDVEKSKRIALKQIDRLARESYDSDKIVTKNEELLKDADQIKDNPEEPSKIVKIKYQKPVIPSHVIKKIPKDYDSSVFKFVSTLIW